MPQPEARLVKKMKDFIQQKGGRCFKIHGESAFQEVGIPDLLCCYRGRFVGLEVKQLGEKPSPVQLVVLNEIVSAGGYASVVSTVGQVALLLERIDQEVARGQGHNSHDLDHRRRVLRDSVRRPSKTK